MQAPRNEVISGPTYAAKIDDDDDDTTVFITVNFQNEAPFEVFIRLDDPALYEWSTAVTLLITRALRAGESVCDIADELSEIHSPRTSHFYNGEQFPSLMSRIGKILKSACVSGNSDYTTA